ncbi:MAG: AI-2E family transporter [Ruminococcaceae bacterium]|nr:AI-2E family transporter [Oscillospiraceae bacterium]
MVKHKIRKIIFYSLIIFGGLALTILFYFMLSNQTGSQPWTKRIAFILRPFIIGGVLAYIMKSTCNFFERIYTKGLLKSGKRSEFRAKKTASRLSLITTYVIWFSVIALLIFIIAKPLAQSIKNLISSLFVNVPVYTEKAIDFVHNKLENYPQIQELFESAINNVSSTFSTWIETQLPQKIEQIGTKLIFGVFDVVVLIKDILIGLIISFLLLSRRKILAEKSKIFVKCIFKDSTANAIIDEFRYADRMFSGFLEGKVIDSALIGVIYYVVLLIMKVPYAPLIAVICGVTNIIPIFGPFIGAIPSALIILTENPVKVIYFLIFVCIMQFIDGNIIDPHIVGGSIKMSSFCVLFAVILFGGLWGFVGLLVGVPVFAVIYDIAKKIIFHLLKKKDKEYLIDEFKQKFPSKESPKTEQTAAKKHDASTAE